MLRRNTCCIKSSSKNLLPTIGKKQRNMKGWRKGDWGKKVNRWNVEPTLINRIRIFVLFFLPCAFVFLFRLLLPRVKHRLQKKSLPAPPLLLPEKVQPWAASSILVCGGKRSVMRLSILICESGKVNLTSQTPCHTYFMFSRHTCF